ncbi:MAG: terminase small subunit [Muribaculaceae bacterium]|nr:terminase small subunit [Muribaculaceae bacterium]
MARTTKTAQGLTEKQERFCIEYVDNGGNASEAYRICYDCSNAKPETVWRNASQLLTNTKVATMIAEIKQSRAQRAERGREICNNALLDIVETTTEDLYYIDPKTGKVRTRSPQQLPKRARNAVKRMSNNSGHVVYELNGKVEAIRTYAAINGLNAAQEVNVNNRGSMFGEIRIGFDDEE